MWRTMLTSLTVGSGVIILAAQASTPNCIVMSQVVGRVNSKRAMSFLFFTALSSTYASCKKLAIPASTLTARRARMSGCND